jgi:hypothetical protein
MIIWCALWTANSQTSIHIMRVGHPEEGWLLRTRPEETINSLHEPGVDLSKGHRLNLPAKQLASASRLNPVNAIRSATRALSKQQATRN